MLYSGNASLLELRFELVEQPGAGFDFDKDFTVTDNTCRVLDKGEQLVLREKFAGKAVIQTERQLQQQAVLARTAASNEVGAVEKGAVQALRRIEDKAEAFERELVKDGACDAARRAILIRRASQELSGARCHSILLPPPQSAGWKTKSSKTWSKWSRPSSKTW